MEQVARQWGKGRILAKSTAISIGRHASLHVNPTRASRQSVAVAAGTRAVWPGLPDAKFLARDSLCQ